MNSFNIQVLLLIFFLYNDSMCNTDNTALTAKALEVNAIDNSRNYKVK
jgi:hypothetical protein